MCKEDNTGDHARESDWEMDTPTTGIQWPGWGPGMCTVNQKVSG